MSVKDCSKRKLSIAEIQMSNLSRSRSSRSTMNPKGNNFKDFKSSSNRLEFRRKSRIWFS